MKDPAPSFATIPIGDFVAALGAKRPVPGGGAAAGSALAHGAALGEMVVAFTLGRKSFADRTPMLEEAAATLERTRRRAFALADEDAAAFDALSKTWTTSTPMPVGERIEAIHRAIAPPAEIIVAAEETATLLATLVGRSNQRLVSDLAIAAGFVALAAEAAEWNVEVNLEAIRTLASDGDAEDPEAGRSRDLVRRTRSVCDRIVEGCRQDPSRPIVD